MKCAEVDEKTECRAGNTDLTRQEATAETRGIV